MIISQRRPEKVSLALAVLAVAISLSICCDELEWSCGTGECLAVEKICDGKVDCADRSDETSDACIEHVCPTFAFRCAYGGCVSDKARCNGTSECADGSDEARLLCATEEEQKDNTSCLSNQFQCKSGECVSQENACDGLANCSDESDETVEACALTVCPSIFFRCGYGACIKKDKKCDKIQDCLDGSDETAILCKESPAWIRYTSTPQKPLVTSTQPPLVTSTQTSIAVVPTQTTSTNKAVSCIAPNIKNSRLVYEAQPTKTVEPGEEVPNFNSILYQCKAGYFREGLSYNICWNGTWYSKQDTICTLYCPSVVLKGVTFNVECLRDRTTVPCDRIKPGTMAKTSCPTKYRIPDRNPTQTLFCEEDGQWDYPPSRCEAICGEELIPSVPFLTYGGVTNITTVPWHVGIYIILGGKYQHHCGGSLISAKVVISAAHCFWDNANEETYDKSMYIVGAGKYYRDFYMDESRKAQFRNISQISIPAEYKGEYARHRADIAGLVLSDALILSEYIAPICIQWKMDGAKAIANGLYGKVAGWGHDENGVFSQELKTINVPGSSYEVCKNEVGPLYANSITDDKFCVLNKLNTNACQGDSGGGFAVKKEMNGQVRYYLWGVVSTGVPFGLTCKNYQFVSYTNIQYFERFIIDLEIHNRPR